MCIYGYIHTRTPHILYVYFLEDLLSSFVSIYMDTDKSMHVHICPTTFRSASFECVFILHACV